MRELQQKFGHVFRNSELLQQALTHRSCGAKNNERLEFIGDGLLNCETALLLFDQFADLDEGSMSRVRAGMVRQDTLVKVAERIGLTEHLRHTQTALTPSMLADALEAMFGAVYLDAGRDAASKIIRQHMAMVLHNGEAVLRKDPKTMLQEYLQARRIALPTYQINRDASNGNVPIEATCTIPSLNIATRGSGMNRRAAESVAADRAMRACQAQ